MDADAVLRGGWASQPLPRSEAGSVRAQEDPGRRDRLRVGGQEARPRRVARRRAVVVRPRRAHRRRPLIEPAPPALAPRVGEIFGSLRRGATSLQRKISKGLNSICKKQKEKYLSRNQIRRVVRQFRRVIS